MSKVPLACVVVLAGLAVAEVSSALGGIERASADGWQKVSPSSVGLDGTKLRQLALRARKAQSSCLLVVRDGKIAGEWYFQGAGRNTAQNVFSVTKSFASTLVGIAQDDGDLRIGSSASTWIPEWRGTPAEAVTVRNLLSNDSGREWSTVTDYIELIGAPDKTAYAIGLKQTSPPGRVWVYNNSAIQTLEQVLERATGEEVAAFGRRRLFRPLGMTQTVMTTDRAGNTQVFQGLRSTCRDLARFGVLMLQNGRWNGKQIVSSGWVRQATGRPSTELNSTYGYLWWLNRKGVMGSPLTPTTIETARNPSTKRGRIVPGAPADMFWALGLGDQIVQVDPGSRTVVVRLAEASPFLQGPKFGPAETSKVVTQAVVR